MFTPNHFHAVHADLFMLMHHILVVTREPTAYSSPHIPRVDLRLMQPHATAHLQHDL